MTSPRPVLEFNYDISCPFAYIASTRVQALAQRTNAQLIYKPVLLGAIYRATAAPQGAAGSASDVFNPTKKEVTKQSMGRTLRRYKIKYNPPPEHPRKSVDALRLLYCVKDGPERYRLTEKLFEAYWVTRRDVTSKSVLLDIARESGINNVSIDSFSDATARKQLEESTAQAIERGAFGVPGFWIPNAQWTDQSGTTKTGRFFWGQDRMHFVEATLLQPNSHWARVPSLKTLIPRCKPHTTPQQAPTKTKLEFWYDFSSPWAFLGYTQLARLQRQFPALQIEMKPFLLGILFREIGAPNLPMAAVSKAKAQWVRQDHADWTAWWNAINEQEGNKDAAIKFHWAEKFPIRTPTVLRVVLVKPETVGVLYSACWEQNADVSNDSVLESVLTQAGYNGAELLAQANAPAAKARLRELTAEAKAVGICGVPTYRVLRQNAQGQWNQAGGLIWGQDETNVLEDVLAGWTEESEEVAEPRKSESSVAKL